MIPDTITLNGDAYVRATPDQIAAEVASWDSDAQAQLFNCLGALCKTWGSWNYAEPHWCDMAGHLNEDGRGVLQSISQFLDD
jgi:hypothetical protein